MTYCDYINTITGDQLSLHKEYHDNHYGFPIENDDELFERLMLEINQAGLNWILSVALIVHSALFMSTLN